MSRKNLIIVICELILISQLVSCTNQLERKVEVQPHKAEQNSFENNSVLSEGKLYENEKFPNQNLIIKPSKIIERLREKRKANPTISAKELAVFGNEILKSSGYDYTFSWEPKGKKNKEN